MGQFQPKPYWQKQKDGHFVKIQPPPQEFKVHNEQKYGRGQNHPQFDLVLLNTKFGNNGV